jgi:hypothetical protein
MGKSPFITEHNVETESIKLTGSSPNSNGTICGRTGTFKNEGNFLHRFFFAKV